MTVRLIQNGQEYREARQMLLDLVGLDPAPGTPEDDQIKPFLSCEGMMVNRSTRNVSCDGVLKSEPAIRHWG